MINVPTKYNGSAKSLWKSNLEVLVRSNKSEVIRWHNGVLSVIHWAGEEGEEHCNHSKWHELLNAWTCENMHSPRTVYVGLGSVGRRWGWKKALRQTEQGLGLGLPQKNILLFQDKKREALTKGIGIYLELLKLTKQEDDTVRLIYLGR